MAGQLTDDDPQGQYDMGMTYLEMGMHEQAVEAFAGAARNEAFREKAMEMLARCHLEAGAPETAVSVVDEALAAGITDRGREAALYAWRGLALEAIGYEADAVAELKRALELEPGLAPALEGLKRLTARAVGDEE
jgi:tetratricopeptide (TPR) repeat protein